MSKREHIVSKSYIDWLKSLGCVFYAPLIQGDLTDHISGQTLIIDNGTVTWDNIENAYRFYGPYSLNKYIASWQNLDMDFNINNFTGSWMYEVKGNNSNIVPICLGGRNFAQSISTGYLNQWFKYATTISNVSPRTQWWYTDGERSSVFPNGYNRGNNPITLTSDAKCGVECNPSGSYYDMLNRTYYIRNVMIFNRELTQQKIMEVQGL